MPRRHLHVILLAALISMACYQQARNRYGQAFSQALNLISRRYVEPVGRGELFDAAMQGMTSSLDEHSRYLTADFYRQFQELLDKEFTGVGIQVTLDPETEQLTVVTPLVGSPALNAGMRAGDVILTVDGTDIQGMTLEEMVARLKGPPGTRVRLEVLHAGADKPLEMTIERADVVADSVLGDTRRPDGSWNFYLEEDPRIGYIRVITFGNHTLEEFQAALDSFESHPVDALLLDLRDNSGGRLDVAVPLCDMFIDEGIIVSTRGRDGVQQSVHTATRSGTIVPRDLPMAVLVNRQSASASEIFAACLQDHERAAIAGERTYGKGTVQEIILLAQGEGALKLTTATYHRPSGENIDRSRADESDVWGVLPDEGLEVALSDEELLEVLTYRAERDIVRFAPDGHTFAPSGLLLSTDEEEEAPPEASTDTSPEEAAANELEEETAPASGHPDPQLQRAVEYLESLIDEPQAAAA